MPSVRNTDWGEALTREAFGLCVSFNPEILLLGQRRADHLERAAPGLPRKVVGNRRVGAALRVVDRELADIHEPVAARKRQTASQQLVHHAEHRGIGANTQGQRSGGDCGEPAVLAQHPQTEQQVVPEIVEPCDAPHVARLLLEKRHVAEGSTSCTLRFVAPEPIGCQFIDELIEVEGDFLTQLQIGLILAEDRSGPVTRDAKKPEDAQRQLRPV